MNTVADRHRFDADPDPTFHFDADPDPDPAPAPIPSLTHGKKIRLKSVSPFTGCAYFSFNKCPIYIHDGTNAKCCTNSDETDYSAPPPPFLFPSSFFSQIFELIQLENLQVVINTLAFESEFSKKFPRPGSGFTESGNFRYRAKLVFVRYRTRMLRAFAIVCRPDFSIINYSNRL
jgi:hypothetical protein